MGTPSSSASPSASNTGVTTTQIAGIDEGDIVKAMGNHLLVLRRGNLFAVDTETMQVSARTAVMPDETSDGWIDELLVHEPTRRAVVVGFVSGPNDEAYTLLHLFNLDEQGTLSRGDAIWLRSEDYFSDENYATRLLGDSLLLYTLHSMEGEEFFPEDFEGMNPNEVAAMRAQMRWDATLPAIRNERGRFEPTWAPRRIVGRREGSGMLHAVTRCDLSRSPVPCTTHGVVEDGDARLFVSPTAAYLWFDDITLIPEPSDGATDAAWDRYYHRIDRLNSISAVYRFPHQGQRTDVAFARGTLASMMHLAEFDGHLHALVGKDGATFGDEDDSDEDDSDEDDSDEDASTGADSEAALLRFDLRAFGRPLRRSDVRHLPSGVPAVARWSGSRAVYGTDRHLVVHDASTRESWAISGESAARVDPIAGGVIITLESPELEFLSVDLQAAPRAVEQRRLIGASSGETRTHGFYFLPTSAGAGTFGVPIVRGGGTRLTAGEAAIAFFSMEDFASTLAGTMHSRGIEVQCQTSCTDWYGNARPVFFRDRIFALMGSEIVEAERRDGRLVETRRTTLR